MKKTLIITLIICSSSGFSQTTVTKTANNVTSIGDLGFLPWWGLTNSLVVDGINIETENCPSSTNQRNDTLLLRNFGFTIPLNSTIEGIELKLVKSASDSNEVQDEIISLFYNTIISSNKANSVFWPMDSTIFIYGGNNDLWTSSLTPNIVNDSLFGVILTIPFSQQWCLNARIDYVDLSITYSISTNINDLLTTERIRTYPNPVKDNFTIKSLNNQTINNVELISLSGQVIINRKYNNQIVELNIEHLPSGIYLLKITNKDNILYRKLIKE